jgi:hypothetical protein
MQKLFLLIQTKHTRILCIVTLVTMLLYMIIFRLAVLLLCFHLLKHNIIFAYETVINNMKMYCFMLHNVTQTPIAFRVHGPFMLIAPTVGPS